MAASVLAAAGCGADQRQDADNRHGTYTVDLERAQFPASQRIAKRSTFVITVRNAGDATIPNLAVTLHGFTRRTGSSRASASASPWIMDAPPPGAQTAIEDTWSAGALQPGDRATLRWRVTPIVAGTHALNYSIAPNLQGRARARLAGGGAPRGTLTVNVLAKPAPSRVDPRTGRVIRPE